MSFPEYVLRSRIARFQELLRSRNVDLAVIRTLFSFTYFTGVKWLRPSLTVPAESEPIAFVARGEEGFKQRAWIRDVRAFAGELMAKVSSLVRGLGASRAGLDFTLERDAYAVFYEMFKRLNRGVEVVDVNPLIMQLRLLKDEFD